MRSTEKLTGQVNVFITTVTVKSTAAPIHKPVGLVTRENFNSRVSVINTQLEQERRTPRLSFELNATKNDPAFNTKYGRQLLNVIVSDLLGT